MRPSRPRMRPSSRPLRCCRIVRFATCAPPAITTSLENRQLRTPTCLGTSNRQIGSEIPRRSVRCWKPLPAQGFRRRRRLPLLTCPVL
jgi:hypothetical protein